MMSSIVVLLKTERLAGDSIETCRFKLEEVVVVQCAVIGSRPRCMMPVWHSRTSVHVSSLMHALGVLSLMIPLRSVIIFLEYELRTHYNDK